MLFSILPNKSIIPQINKKENSAPSPFTKAPSILQAQDSIHFAGDKALKKKDRAQYYKLEFEAALNGEGKYAKYSHDKLIKRLRKCSQTGNGQINLSRELQQNLGFYSKIQNLLKAGANPAELTDRGNRNSLHLLMDKISDSNPDIVGVPNDDTNRVVLQLVNHIKGDKAAVLNQKSTPDGETPLITYIKNIQKNFASTNPYDPLPSSIKPDVIANINTFKQNGADVTIRDTSQKAAADYVTDTDVQAALTT